jgi:hypothetical protein
MQSKDVFEPPGLRILHKIETVKTFHVTADDSPDFHNRFCLTVAIPEYLSCRFFQIISENEQGIKWIKN